LEGVWRKKRTAGKRTAENRTAEHRTAEHRTAKNRTAGNRTAGNRTAGGVRGRGSCGLLLAAGMLLLVSGCSVPRWPVDGVMTSPYGLRMRGWRPTLHHGVDVAAPTGTPVRAMKAGRVERAGPMGGYGLTVVMSHGGNVRTLYAHLSRIDVSAGQSVGGGHVIGAVGQTGNATGPHLHFEITRWGRAEDPVVLLGRMP
jgi:murein DD-endopeptidase MepM/ murein hydrolase activator NlpD